MHMYLFKWLKFDLIIIKKQYIFLQMISDVFCLSIFLEGSAESLQDTWSTSGLCMVKFFTDYFQNVMYSSWNLFKSEMKRIKINDYLIASYN